MAEREITDGDSLQCVVQGIQPSVELSSTSSRTIASKNGTKIGSSALPHLRTVLHMDMDCFYAQVETERFPTWRREPVAVVQNATLCVTSNYRIRMRGGKKIGQASVVHSIIPETKFAGRYVSCLK